MQLIKDLWHGDVPLLKTFWLFGVCVGVLFKAVFVYFTFQPKIFSTDIGWILFLSLAIVGLIYSPFIFVSTWRSANKYKGLSRYAILAKVMVIFGWMGYVRDLIEMAKPLLD